MNRNRNILKTISSRGLSMNNIVHTTWLSIPKFIFIISTFSSHGIISISSAFETTRQIRLPSFTHAIRARRIRHATRCRRCRRIYFPSLGISRPLSFFLIVPKEQLITRIESCSRQRRQSVLRLITVMLMARQLCDFNIDNENQLVHREIFTLS